MDDQTELERWWDKGPPPDMFRYPEVMNIDMHTFIGVILDHLEAKRG